MEKSIDPHKAAVLIKAAAVMQHRTQYNLALTCNIKPKHLNEFLNRHVNLLPEQIDCLLDALDLGKAVARLSAPAGEI